MAVNLTLQGPPLRILSAAAFMIEQEQAITKLRGEGGQIRYALDRKSVV